MRKISLIIVHCTATREGRDYSVKDVDRWHRERGFKMIGYHYLIHLDGTIEQGRPESMIGAHCTDHNKHSIGVCYVGGLRPSPPNVSPPNPRGGDSTPNASPPNVSPPNPRGGDSTPNSNHSSPLKGEAGRGALVPADTRTSEQKRALLELLTQLKQRYPHAIITGHNTFARKACPCFDAAAEYLSLSNA